MFRSSPAAAVLMAACLAASATAEDKPTLAGARFGSPIVGPAVEPTGLKGHAVVVEMWGVN